MLHKYLNIQNMHEDFFFFFSLGPWQEGVRGPCDRQVIVISSGKLPSSHNGYHGLSELIAHEDFYLTYLKTIVNRVDFPQIFPWFWNSPKHANFHFVYILFGIILTNSKGPWFYSPYFLIVFYWWKILVIESVVA